MQTVSKIAGNAAAGVAAGLAANAIKGINIKKNILGVPKISYTCPIN